jgi:hypothetical protein
MRRLIVLAALGVGLIAATTTGAAGRASVGLPGCAYKSPSIDVTVEVAGPDLGPGLCRIFASSLHWPRYYGWNVGRSRCVWKTTLLDVRLTVWSHSATIGQLMCKGLAPRLRTQWVRVR